MCIRDRSCYPLYTIIVERIVQRHINIKLLRKITITNIERMALFAFQRWISLTYIRWISIIQIRIQVPDTWSPDTPVSYTHLESGIWLGHGLPRSWL